MKKTKLLVPAMVVLAFSTAASVSGTVAWFQAARSATVTANNTVINPEGNLLAVATPLVAMEEDTSGTEGRALKQAAKTALRDASMDIGTNGKAKVNAYRAVLGDNGNVASYAVVTDANTSTVGDTTIYYYASWEVTFSVPTDVEGGTSSASYDVYFDETGSTASYDASNKVAAAYRVAMTSAASVTPTVWAPVHTVGEATYEASYVNGTVVGTNDQSKYNCVSGKVASTSTATAAHATANYLGTISYASSLTVTFYAWFEGTDTVLTDANLKSLESASLDTTMSFNAIDTATYAA